jgi:hypothetical protein
MSGGKYLEEARKSRKLDRFCNEHPSKADRARFIALLNAMSKGVFFAHCDETRKNKWVSPIGSPQFDCEVIT